VWADCLFSRQFWSALEERRNGGIKEPSAANLRVFPVHRQYIGLPCKLLYQQKRHESDEEIEVDESLYRCYMMVQKMLREANSALNSPKSSLLLRPDTCEVGIRSVVNPVLVDVAASPVLVSCKYGIERATELLRVQLARNVPLLHEAHLAGSGALVASRSSGFVESRSASKRK
jgi:hypothetical protein